MASTSSSGHAELEHSDVAGQVCEVDVVGEQDVGPLSGTIQEIRPCAVSTNSLPMAQLQEHERVCEFDLNMEPGVLSVASSNVPESEHILEPKHKVFLSHSGAQKDFVEQLCVDLERCDRYPFFDKLPSSLPIGEKFSRLIFDAIEQCKVGVVVLTEEFLMGKWPMFELNAMVMKIENLNAKMTIIPVFYGVSIEELKNFENYSRWTSQWEAWALNDERINVVEWKRALKFLEPINGIMRKEGLGDVKLREMIVVEVCKLVAKTTRWDDSHVQGCSRICKVVEDKIHQVTTKSRVSVVGLYGMRGIGKTTISKALCNKLSSKFSNNVCHIELGSDNGMQLLQKALKKLTNLRHDIVDKLDDIEEGYAYLKKLRKESIFLALDNVQDDWKSREVVQRFLKAGYECGSVVFVTAHSLDILKKLGLSGSNCLEMPNLEGEEARCLFLRSADLPLEDRVDELLVEKCIERCHFLKGNGCQRHYHPLALKVLGQQFGCNPIHWTLQLEKIKTFNQSGNKEHPIFCILRSSFDSLKQEHQEIFMDLALYGTYYLDNVILGINRRDWLCMIHQESVEDMKDMLQALKEKSLVEDLSADFTKIGIHDLWVEFAVAETKAHDYKDQRWVYQVDGKVKGALQRSSQWGENVERMVFLKDGWKALEGVNLKHFVNVEAFKLEVDLYLADCELPLDLKRMEHLRSLDVDTPGLTVRAYGLSSLTNLAFLSYNTPGFAPCLNEIGRLTNLQVLELRQCKGVKVLDLTELRLLRTAWIRELPDLIAVKGLSSRMANLRILLITHCKSLRECHGVGELYTLESLEFSRCGQLKELPWLGRLTTLRALAIKDCKSLRAVPGLDDLVALEEFFADGCWKLATLPDLVKLTKLRVLDIGESPVQEVSGWDGLISLTSLIASFGKLSGEQPDLSKLSALIDVNITGWIGPICTSIRSLQMLEALELWDCKGEDVVPEFQSLTRLKTLLLWNCEYRDLSGLSNATALESLWIGYCDKLERSPEFERLKKLTELRIIMGHDLRDWPRERTLKLAALKSLEVDKFFLMRIVRGLEMVTGLQELTLHKDGCESVLSKASLISHLEILKIHEFSTMEALDVGNFSQLNKLELWRCRALKRVACCKPLTALRKLKMRDCESLVEMPDLSVFPHLEELRLEKCRAVTRLNCSSALPALRKIELISCNSQVAKLEFNRFPNLVEFVVENDSSSQDGNLMVKVKKERKKERRTLVGPVPKRGRCE